MGKQLFTPEELRRADEEIEREFRVDREEREANREARAAYQREYYEKNRETRAAYQREYYEKNREAISAKRRERYEANRANDTGEGGEARRIRLSLGMTQKEFASMLGVSHQIISAYETCVVPVGWRYYEAAGLIDKRKAEKQ